MNVSKKLYIITYNYNYNEFETTIEVVAYSEEQALLLAPVNEEYILNIEKAVNRYKTA